jgi:predicted Fe-Mo cluster-binding NifX family protein
MKVVIPTNDQKTLAPRIGMAKGYLIIDTKTNQTEYLLNEVLRELIKEHKKIHGDCGEHGFGIGQILPKKLKEKNVDLFVAKTFGEGMLGNLDYYGINTFVSKKHNISDILEELKEIYGDK